MLTETKYLNQAINFLRRYHLRILITKRSGQRCPNWTPPQPGYPVDCPTGACAGVHGWQYTITIRRNGQCWILGSSGLTEISFPYWGSANDRHNHKTPSAYDVLACVASDANLPTDPDELVRELGVMPPSQVIASTEHTIKLRAFFNPYELKDLGKIQ